MTNNLEEIALEMAAERTGNNGQSRDNASASEQPDTDATPAEGDWDDLDEAFAHYNERYAVALFGNKAVVVVKPQPGQKFPKFLTFDAFNNWRSKDRIDLPDRNGNVRNSAVSTLWLKWRDRASYDDVVFEPYGIMEKDQTPSGVLNLFQGWPIKPDFTAGRCDLFLEHVWSTICHGDKKRFEWIMSWLAQMVREPQKKPGSVIVLRGDKGTGKSAFLEAVAMLFHPAHVVRAQREADLLGNFNVHLAYALFVGVDEALFALDPRVDGPLKNIITGPELFIEPKGVDKISVKNNIHMVMATNEDVAVPITDGDRRYDMHDVDDAHKDDKPWFEEMFRELKEGGAAALLSILVDWVQPDHVKLHKPHMGEAAMDAVELNWKPHVKWFAGVLRKAEKLEGDLAGLRWSLDGGASISRQAFSDAWENYARSNGIHRPAGKPVLGKMLKKLGVEDERPSGGREYVFPPLAAVRAAFKATFGGDVGEGDLSAHTRAEGEPEADDEAVWTMH